MFDISFGEILLICVVALVVLGPERLPAVARTLGALVARAQRFVASVKADIGQHTDLANLAALKQEVQQTAAAFHSQLSADVAEVQQTIHQARDETVGAIEATGTPVEAIEAASAPVEPANAPLEPGVEQPTPRETPPVVPVVNENQLDLFADPPAASTSHESSR
ncbi:Sec-independent protein translocase protein TatB [Paludibacterium purpuratum]|uniref:Sec-independent protein translocase protein TatB n=1 Tax=Paludibacterium purpuratum TaxID=1144873 RepID=A0A4R7B9F2_9NEIS|nr:Sec-independent protein translocase protein TatB [Paludibacterium purpuratum]TDR80612.1 sec-independent protein translocase protein TatB [Paludibacterium purpuratum]